MARYGTEFVVLGGSPFPLDMLRYDGCYPVSQEDVAQIHSSVTMEVSRAVVKLRCNHDGPKPDFTPERWESFGWRIDRDRVVTVKL